MAELQRGRAKPALAMRFPLVSPGSLDGAADRAELARSVLAEKRDRSDADNGDERHEEGVLNERRTTIGLATGLQPGADELIRSKHFGWSPLSSADEPRVPRGA